MYHRIQGVNKNGCFTGFMIAIKVTAEAPVCVMTALSFLVAHYFVSSDVKNGPERAQNKRCGLCQLIECAEKMSHVAGFVFLKH